MKKKIINAIGMVAACGDPWSTFLLICSDRGIQCEYMGCLTRLLLHVYAAVSGSLMGFFLTVGNRFH